MTSNLGTEFAGKGGVLGFIPSVDEKTIADHQKIEKAMRDTFRPEFLNRVDEILIFSQLSLEDVEQMVDLQMQSVAEQLGEYNIQLHLTEPARHWLAKTGYDPQFGARPLRRTIQRYVENPLSVRLLRNDFHNGDLIVIDELNGQLIFERHKDSSSDYLQSPAPAEATKFDEDNHLQSDEVLPESKTENFDAPDLVSPEEFSTEDFTDENVTFEDE
jgi:ATP-dependent Clp protease ATP-binding subunit ClpC